MKAKPVSDATYDVIVIGGGPNGMVASAMLAKAGRKVLLLERSIKLGSIVTAHEITPGYFAPAGPHLLDSFSPSLEKRLRLKKHGLQFAKQKIGTIALERDGHNLVLPTLGGSITGLSATDAKAYATFAVQLRGFARLYGHMCDDRLKLGTVDALRNLVCRLALTRGLSSGDLLQMAPASLSHVLDATFESPLLKGALALDALMGQGDSPREPGTFLRLVQRQSLRLSGRIAAQPLGGMSAYGEALCASFVAHGGEIRYGVNVARILTDAGAVQGVETAQGEKLMARQVLSCLDPVTTMIDLVGASHLDAGMARRLAKRKYQGATAKINLALDGLPVVKGLSPDQLGNRLLIAPSLSDVEQAALSFKRREFHSDPVMDIHMPSVLDASLAPQGQHVMSIIVQYVPHDLVMGWSAGREKLVQNVVRALASYMPDLPNRIVAGEVLTPPDIEAKYGLKQGDWHHGAMSLDRLLLLSPAAAMQPHQTPLAGLYLGGAGSYVGSASGQAGSRAAAVMLKGKGGK